ncbi:trypsin-like peptidase domain-containing protein [Streptomyces sp. NPDC020490]|uniref:S1C family serine protease n=1 Tax=Streptomyces sp. NPDC020490 TaxID=3365078 RepID=UPI0037B146D5
MNEGKPTKAKWWSRPRPQGPSDPSDPSYPSVGAEGTDPAPAAPATPAPDGGFADGDFELAKPAAAAPVEPVAPSADHAGTGVPADRPGTDGDFELERPAAAVPAAAPDPLTFAAAPVAERPSPLHDPDPYSTPPYGEPGPWAPAPPVQHPAATPTHGTPAPMPGTAVTPPQTPLPAPGATVTPPPALVQQTPVQPVQQTPVQPTQPGLVQPTQPGLVQPAAPGPAVAAAPGPAVPAAPGPAVPAAPGPAVPAAPGPVAPAAPGAHAPGAHAPAALGAHAPAAPLPVGAAPVPQPVASPGGDVPPASPWRNYDPWAAAPLQHTGAPRPRRARKGLVAGAVALALVSGGVGGALGSYLERHGGVGDVELPQAGKEPTGRAPDSVAGIAARALPSVVTLHVTGQEESGTGTGFVLDAQGHILTNNHVVEPAGSGGRISVTFSSGDTAKATVVGRDSGYDLAVVQVDGVSGLKPMPLGNSDNVQVGDPVVAIGAPFDLEGTVTSGIISAKERPITAGGESGDGSDVSYVDALQTDAPINPGNSGGPLLDSKARVIGINSAIRSADSGSQPDGGQAGSIGLGFAIPVNQAKRVAEELINTGKATHPVIGVTLDMDYSGDGARVGTKGSGGGPAVNAGGPGDKAGIEPGDVITEVDGQRVHSGEELIVKIRAHRPGDRLELTVRRDGIIKKIPLVLGSSDGN